MLNAVCFPNMNRLRKCAVVSYLVAMHHRLATRFETEGSRKGEIERWKDG